MQLRTRPGDDSIPSFPIAPAMDNALTTRPYSTASFIHHRFFAEQALEF
ncbi:hypothetical protein ACVXG9_26480 [Escherichia coli]